MSFYGLFGKAIEEGVSEAKGRVSHGPAFFLSQAFSG